MIIRGYIGYAELVRFKICLFGNSNEMNQIFLGLTAVLGLLAFFVFGVCSSKKKQKKGKPASTLDVETPPTAEIPSNAPKFKPTPPTSPKPTPLNSTANTPDQANSVSVRLKTGDNSASPETSYLATIQRASYRISIFRPSKDYLQKSFSRQKHQEENLTNPKGLELKDDEI